MPEYRGFISGRVGFVQNPGYSSGLSIRNLSAQDAPELGIRHGEEIYDLVSGSADLSFLNEPEKMVDLHTIR